MGMVKAKRPAVLVHDGAEVRLHGPGPRGLVSYLDEHHPLVLAHPEVFTPALRRAADSRERVAASFGFYDGPVTERSVSAVAETPTAVDVDDLPRRRQPWRLRAADTVPERHVSLTDGVDAVPVQLGARALDDMLRAAAAHRGLEVGGILFSREVPCSWKPISIGSVSLPGPRAELGPTAHRADGEYDYRVVRQMERDGWREIGSWHVHVRRAGQDRKLEETPSLADLRRWGALRHTLSVFRYVGLIVIVPEVRSLTIRPSVVTWTVRDSISGRNDICQRSRLIG